MNEPIAWFNLANARLAQGRVDEAHLAISNAIAVCQQLGEQWFLAYCLNTLGSIEFTQGNLQAANMHYKTAHELRQKFGDAEGMAVALNNLGEIALATGESEAARQHFELSLALYQDLNDRGGLATALKGLGNVECAQAHYDKASLHFAQSLQLSLAMNYVSLMFNLLLAIAGLLLRVNRAADAESLLKLVLHHPSSDERCRLGARETLDQMRVAVTPSLVETNWQAMLTAESEKVILLLEEIETQRL